MKKKVVIIDYGMGNLLSIERAIMHVGGAPEISNDPLKIAAADRLLLPGVGAFGEGIRILRSKSLVEPILKFVKTGRPILGICLGMQLFLSESQEFGRHIGLDLIRGKVVHFSDFTREFPNLKIPHVGWNKVMPPENNPPWEGTVLAEINPDSYFYFVHSFFVAPEDNSHMLAVSRYGADSFCSVLRKDNIYGCQFHPEKSSENGLKIYRNFIYKM